MRVAACVVAALFFLPIPAATSPWVANAQQLLKAVFPITYEGEGGCTGALIDAELDRVLTAGHCRKDKLYVDQIPAKEIAFDIKKDLLVLEVKDIGDDRVAFKLAADDPKPGEQVASIGFGYGWEKPMLRISHVSNIDVDVPETGKGPFVVFDTPFVGGQSGGPVVNQAGEIVALVQMASDRVGLGISAETIRSKVGRYFSKSK